MDNNTNNVQSNQNFNNLIQPDIQYDNLNNDTQTNSAIAPNIDTSVEIQNIQQTLSNTEANVNDQFNLQMQNSEQYNNTHPHVDIEAHIKDQLQNIPTVEQDKQAFINNVQNMNQETPEQKKEGVNVTFIIILFIIIFAVMYFLFPILLNYI